MFIPVIAHRPEDKKGPEVKTVYVALERIKWFFKADGDNPYVISTGDAEYNISEETFELLKSLVLRK